MKVMRRFLLFVALIVLLGGTVVFTSAAEDKPTIHALLVIMDGDALNAEQYEESGSKISLLLRDAKDTVCNLKLTELRSGSDNVSHWPTKDRVLQWVREVRPEKNDVVFIYFVGHGGKAHTTNDSTFNGTFLALAGPSDQKYLFRRDLVNTLKAAPAWQSRLKMIITDTCSAEVPFVDYILGPIYSLRSIWPPVSYKEPVYRNLFVEHEGFLHLTSATEKQYSWGDSKRGTWFTYGLVSAIDSYASGSTDPGFVGWDKVFTLAKEKVPVLIALHPRKVGNNVQHPKYYGALPKRVQASVGKKSSPKANIQKVWVDHNQFEDSVKGMRIHVKFDVDHFKDSKGRVIAYFYKKNGDALKDFNEKYDTIDGYVCVWKNFTPLYDNTLFSDFKLFMPYREFHRPQNLGSGKHDLKFRVRIFDDSIPLSDRSDWVHFWFDD